ncbi:hypothetical protein SmJEL517_g03465 [Synchytrium microbalum]|uniref:Cytochrome P450 n=1 Tax=Synchytrium microbalum TaxID=1806994 RepID=A0A507C6K6_9FUNG|nr:uncharacterized protein SmJEL517_g03465 [Synchytrium microbalum]TPX33694.1 hypothetical protein SmJEL517_g03465 [Synchytrium microbalum]
MDKQIKALALAAGIATGLSYSLWLGYWLFVSPLRKIPGPVIYVALGSIALQLERLLSGQQPMVVRRRMHEKYGAVVRIGPNELSVGDPAIARHVLVVEDFPKSASAAGLFGPMHPGAIVSLRNKEEHRKVRRFMSPAFSIKGIDKLEPIMHQASDELVAKFERLVKEGNGEAEVDIWHELHSVAIENIGRCAFGRKFDAIEHYSPFATYLSVTANVQWFRALSWMPMNQYYQKMQHYCENYMQEVVNERRAVGEGTTADLLELLVHGKDPETGEKLNDRQVMTQIMNFLTAGGDSTAGAMSFTVLCLIDDKEAMKKYVDEVMSCPVDPETDRLVTSHIKSCKYINAAVNETLRLYTGRDFQRAAPEGADSIIGGYTIPANTTVNVSRYALHRHTPTWGDPDKFRPERFIDEERESQDFFAFSQGSRNCIGKHFAILLNRIIVPELVRRFEFEDVAGQSREVGLFVNIMIKTHAYRVRIRRRQTP